MTYIHRVPPMLCTPNAFPCQIRRFFDIRSYNQVAPPAAHKARDQFQLHAGCRRAKNRRSSGVADVYVTGRETRGEHLVVAHQHQLRA